MKNSLTISLLLVSALISHSSYADCYSRSMINVEDSNYCTVDNTNPASWLNCDGKRIHLNGHLTPPQEIMQHPVLSHSQLFPSGLGGKLNIKRTLQNYMNVGKRQIILLSDTLIECVDEMEVKGMLEKVSLGGEPGTKNSYEGWSIRVFDYHCS
ncbi:hypothetical protein [Candidatus Parabeggiatoa sp. HSG14]|uniref:hypothetical protein n=1 Tax=Candidatus Parabeggiatoa sp. HSG14 TaxID=3055593 RepID=UPI0025A8CB41|nr:hypothetical protein [Thiotrichales bacterium HSG14]